ncbi:hypothetical protein G4228_002023 [Cervus hanglu yarkandensis]|nr:hypothetical protein G4228_002023 [Cervus hanglu yarkandensis]
MGQPLLLLLLVHAYIPGSNEVNVVEKGCTHPEKTNRSMSYRTGNQIITLSEAVCRSDLCNKPNPGPDATVPRNHYLECASCASTDLSCERGWDQSLQCRNSGEKCVDVITHQSLKESPGDERHVRGCGILPGCPGPTGFHNNHTFHFLQCCNTTKCNVGPVLELQNLPPNGLQCYSCEGNSTHECSSEETFLIDCRGPMNQCLEATGTKGAGQEVQTENVTVAEGGVAEITCRLHQYDGSIVVIQNPARQTLFFNGTRALKDERFQLEEFSPRRVRIRLSDARLEDEGGYFCQLYTEDTHHQIATLTVLVAPENPIVEVREQAVEGGEVELSCLVPRSRPAALLRWYRDRKELKGVTSGQENGKVWSVASTVRFRVDRKDDGGIVICEAQNQALPSGHSKQTQYVLDVQYSPTARIHASQAVVREGDTLVLTCAVTGNPRPNQIRWNRGNESLPERAEAVGETLTLPGLVSADNGTYTCEASNKHGHARALYVLVVYDPGAVVEAQTSVPYAIVGGILALLVFLIICVLVGMVWCSVRQKGSYLTHEASGLDEQGEAREAFLNGSDGHKRKEEFFI